MTLLSAALLGILQGLTEFLPVSSSAHLILARAFFGWERERYGLPFDVACHIGTLLALTVYFRRDAIAMLRAVPRMMRPARSAPARQLWLLVASTVPVAIVGLFSTVERLRTAEVAATALALGAVALLVAERMTAGTRQDESLTLFDALAVGSAQAAALIPGVSRSGATIAMGMFLGLRREAAARFGLLIGIPAVLAAGGREALPAMREMVDPEVAAIFAVGMVVSALVGYLTVKYFIRYLTRHSLDVFAYYRLALAAATGLWILSGSR